jgi:hypothetical protein
LIPQPIFKTLVFTPDEHEILLTVKTNHTITATRRQKRRDSCPQISTF